MDNLTVAGRVLTEQKGRAKMTTWHSKILCIQAVAASPWVPHTRGAAVLLPRVPNGGGLEHTGPSSGGCPLGHTASLPKGRLVVFNSTGRVHAASPTPAGFVIVSPAESKTSSKRPARPSMRGGGESTPPMVNPASIRLLATSIKPAYSDAIGRRVADPCRATSKLFCRAGVGDDPASLGNETQWIGEIGSVRA